MQKEILKLVKAAVEGNKEAQEQIEQILQVAQQPGADPKIIKAAEFIMQVLQPESAKKGTKMKKKPLIPTKKCGNKVKKGGFGLHSKKCSCMLHRVGGTIIEVDSCTGLPYRRSGGILKGNKGFAAWYNTAAKTGSSGNNEQTHYFKDGNQWKKQTFTDGKWGEAVDYNFTSADYNNSDFYNNAFVKGYDPTTGFFATQGDYDAALENKDNIKIGNNTQVTRGGTTLTFVPVKASANDQPGYGINNGTIDKEGAWGIIAAASHDENAAKEDLWNQRNYYRQGIRNKSIRDNWFSTHFNEMKQMGIIGNNVNINDVNTYDRKNYLKKFLGTNQTINRLYSGNAKTYGNANSQSKLGNMANTIIANAGLVQKFNEPKSGVTAVAPTSSETTPVNTTTSSKIYVPSIDANVSFKKGGQLKIKLK